MFCLVWCQEASSGDRGASGNSYTGAQSASEGCGLYFRGLGTSLGQDSTFLPDNLPVLTARAEMADQHSSLGVVEMTNVWLLLPD